MNVKKCLQILREIKDVAFASVDENGIPQVRIIDVMLIEHDQLYFCTARGKPFYKQLIDSPHVALTGMNQAYQMVRLVGKAEKLAEQEKWIDRFFDENPSLKAVYPGKSRYILEPFCIKDGQIEIFDLGTSPINRQSFAIGQAKIEKKGFEITEACIECDLCKSHCPQQCIDAGSPYRIQQAHCLHCGLCFEDCPAQAIIRRDV